MVEEKFTPDYFKKHYHVGEYYGIKNVVFRNEDSSGESQFVKSQCLKACFTYFVGEDLTNIESMSQHFTRSDRVWRDTITRCCCSQEEEDGIMHGVVTHKLTNISFIVGQVCLFNTFINAKDKDTFWKEECKYCGEIVAKKSTARKNFCNQKCAKKHNEQEREQERQQVIAEWKIECEEREKKLNEKAILYQPLQKAHDESVKKIWERLEKLEISNEPRKKVYTHCQGCNKPKTCENHQKWPLCFKCNEKKKSLDNRL